MPCANSAPTSGIGVHISFLAIEQRVDRQLTASKLAQGGCDTVAVRRASEGPGLSSLAMPCAKIDRPRIGAPTDNSDDFSGARSWSCLFRTAADDYSAVCTIQIHLVDASKLGYPDADLSIYIGVQRRFVIYDTAGCFSND